MCRTLAFHPYRACIDCGNPHERHPRSWRCWSCQAGAQAARQKAVAAVKKAIKAFILPPPDTVLCIDCEMPACEYEHRDYRKPMDVNPICRKCNIRRGPAAWKESA
jgi:hypothetical protein